MSAWAALNGRRKIFVSVAAAVVLVSVAYALTLRYVYFGDQAVTAIDDIGEALAAAIAAVACALAASRAAGKDRLGWALMGISASLWAAGEVVWSIYEVGLAVDVPYPSLADVAFLTAQGAFGSVGNVIDTGWFAGYLLIALAAIYPAAPPKVAAQKAPLDLWQLALPWMTLLLASAGDVYAALSGHELDLFMSSLTATLALLLTVNMIIERQEFLSILSELEESHTTLNQEFKTALVGIERSSKQVQDAERLEVDEVRRLAADINRTAVRLDRMIEKML